MPACGQGGGHLRIDLLAALRLVFVFGVLVVEQDGIEHVVTMLDQNVFGLLTVTIGRFSIFGHVGALLVFHLKVVVVILFA